MKMPIGVAIDRLENLKLAQDDWENGDLIEDCSLNIEALQLATDIMHKYQKIKKILNTNVVYRDSNFMKLSAIKRVIDGDKQEDIFWKFIDEVEDGKNT